MNKLIFLFIAIAILLIWYTCPIKINQTELDSKIINGWWIGSESFLDQAGLKYMFINLESTINGANLDIVGFLIAGDNEGILYNTPVTMKLNYKEQIDNIKATYIISLGGKEEKLPFSNDSSLVLDRANATLSIYKNNILYVHCSKS